MIMFLDRDALTHNLSLYFILIFWQIRCPLKNGLGKLNLAVLWMFTPGALHEPIKFLKVYYALLCGLSYPFDYIGSLS